LRRIGFIGVGLAFTVATGIALSDISNRLEAKEVQGVATNPTRIESLKKFTDVLQIIDKYYVDEITLDELVKKSIQGLLANLDAHSGYLDKKQYKDLKVQTDGEFGGLGITVGMKNDVLTVISPIDGTPAFKAGIKAGDVILKIEDQSTLNMNIDDAVNLMRGKAGTKIKITIFRKGAPKPLPFEITRDIINIQSVTTKLLSDGILHIRVSSFDKKVVETVQKDIEKHSTSIKGIALDLRNNPGGLLDQAVDLVDLFIEKGIIVSQKGRAKDENVLYEAKAKGTFKDIPLVVLINEGSASASEIVSGALQDHKRAIIVGEKSFGKGSVQVVLPIDKDNGIRLTIARYYLPSGRSIQAVGVTPDVIVKQGVIQEDNNEFALKESDLKEHLKSEVDKLDGKESVKTDTPTDMNSSKDVQLQTAVGVLKALIITNRR
jgi:carboxyl-terminal processing protease